MSALALTLILAVIGGLGLAFLIASLVPRRLSPEEAEIRAAMPQNPQAARPAAASPQMRTLARELGGKKSLVQDAKMVGRTLESHAVTKTVGAVAGVVVLGGGGMFISVLGAGISVPILVVAAAVGALLGWWLPDSMLASEAEKQRGDFQQVAESWLELAGQLVTAGSDTFAALVMASSYSDQPAFVTLREALRASAARGEPPWTGLRRLADERRLRFLDPFCAALELAGTTGAGSREAILTQVDSARSKALHEADARAAASGEKMGAPLALIGGAFMVIMGYPPLAGIMDSATLTGPGL